MDDRDLRHLVEEISTGALHPDDAVRRLSRLPYADLGFARVDHHRALRQKRAEAVYGPGKTPPQCAAIVAELLSQGSGPVLLTRASRPQVEECAKSSPGGEATPHQPVEGRLATVVWRRADPRAARVLLCSAGTADEPVLEECAATLSAYGFAPVEIRDCGVAGVHRLLSSYDDLVEADAVVVVAGMEGALASLVGGLTPAPVVAVPTSTGYGAALEGVTALLSMHASCASGITVVGIDNGYGAACAVARMLP